MGARTANGYAYREGKVVIAGLFPRFTERRIRKLRRGGDRSMLARDWQSAADFYGRVIAIRSIPEIQIQLGHALKEAGAIEDAERVYATVSADSEFFLEARFHRAVLLGRRGQSEEAMEELVAVLRADAGHRGAFAELIHLGGRRRLPEDFQSNAQLHILPRIIDDVARLRHELAALEAASVFPTTAYDSFRRAHPTPPPPLRTDRSLVVLVDARDVGSAFIRSTLISLIDQTMQDWTAVVFASESSAQHSVASLAASESRFTFANAELAKIPTIPFVHITAGTLLDPHALAWFTFVLARNAPPAIWGDFDFGWEDSSGLLRHSSPSLWGTYDRDLLAQSSMPPAVILVDPCQVSCPPLDEKRSSEWRRGALLVASYASHVPRLLATILRIPDAALGAPDDGMLAIWSTEPDSAPPSQGRANADGMLEIIDRGRRPRLSISSPLHDERIGIIIQTRDAADILATSVETMRDHAARPDLLKIVVVDNGSRDSVTLDYLLKLENAGTASIVRLDEPFNWARGNNVAIRTLDSDIMLFANNDLEMLTPRWDDLLRGYMQRDETGIVGARLLYPDGPIQHAGILFGVGNQGPVHDGANIPADDSGPLDRYDLTRTVAAVTGAFMAVRKNIFSQTNGFDELRMAVAYNDIELCLQVRALGYKVIYAPAIELIHYESKSRGRNVGRSRVAWDLGEFTSLRRRWQKALTQDPSYNLHWSPDRPFDGFREPTISQVLDALDRNSRPNPWKVDPAIDT